MARRTHDGKLHPIVNPDPSVATADGMRPDVGLVVEGPTGPVPVAGTSDGKIKVETAGGGGGGGASAADEDAFVEGSTTFTPVGGVYDDSLGDLTGGWLGVGRLTKQRAAHANLRRDDGTELGVPGAPVVVGDGGGSVTMDDGGGSVTTDSPDGAHVALGATTDAEAVGDGGIIAILKRIRTKIGEIVTALAGTLTVAISGTPAVTLNVPVVIDAGNSTTSPLGVSISFTGTWTDVSAYAGVSVNAVSDQNSAANGAELQFSSNGVDIDNRELFFLTGSVAGTGRAVFSPVRARYFRFKYLNGTVAQTLFRVQALLHPQPQPPLGDAIIADGKSAAISALPVAAYSFAFNGASWDRVRGNQISITLLASTPRTATATSAAQNNFTAGGTVLFLNVTAAPGSPGAGGLQVFFEAQDTLTGVWSRLNATPVTVTAAGSYLYVIGAGASAPLFPQSGGRVVLASGLPLSRTWRAVVTHLDAQSYTYSLANQYVA